MPFIMHASGVAVRRMYLEKPIGKSLVQLSFFVVPLFGTISEIVITAYIFYSFNKAVSKQCGDKYSRTNSLDQFMPPCRVVIHAEIQAVSFSYTPKSQLLGL